MKQKICVANWKMKLSLAGSLALARQYRRLKLPRRGLEVVVCPSPLAISAVAKLWRWNQLVLGVQDVAPVASGAYTGDTSAAQAAELGVRYAIVGHSERRAHYGESNQLISQKAAAALSSGLTPIVCLGESRAERDAGTGDQVVERHFRELFAKLSVSGQQQVVVAYEPSWTISDAGDRPATAAEVEHRCHLIEELIIDHYGVATFDARFRIVYGGTVNSATIQQFLAISALQGFLVGSASLDIEDWQGLVSQLANTL